MKVKLAALLVAATLFGGAAAAPAPDPLLAGSSNPCMESSDYVPGVDATGHDVPPADVEAAKVPVPGQIIVPLKGRRGAALVLDGKQVAGLLDPPRCGR